MDAQKGCLRKAASESGWPRSSSHPKCSHSSEPGPNFHYTFHMVQLLFSFLLHVRASGQDELVLQISYNRVVVQLPGACQNRWSRLLCVVNLIRSSNFSVPCCMSEPVAKMNLYCRFHTMEWVFSSPVHKFVFEISYNQAIVQLPSAYQSQWPRWVCIANFIQSSDFSAPQCASKPVSKRLYCKSHTINWLFSSPVRVKASWQDEFVM